MRPSGSPWLPSMQQSDEGLRAAAALLSLSASSDTEVSHLLAAFHLTCAAGRLAACANLLHLHLHRAADAAAQPAGRQGPWSLVALAYGATRVTLAAQQLQQLVVPLQQWREGASTSSSGSGPRLRLQQLEVLGVEARDMPCLLQLLAALPRRGALQRLGLLDPDQPPCSRLPVRGDCSRAAAVAAAGGPASQLAPWATPPAAAGAAAAAGGGAAQRQSSVARALEELQLGHLGRAASLESWGSTAVGGTGDSQQLHAASHQLVHTDAVCGNCAQQQQQAQASSSAVASSLTGLVQLSISGRGAWCRQVEEELLVPLAPQLHTLALVGLGSGALPQGLLACNQLTELVLEGNWHAVGGATDAVQQLEGLAACSSLQRLQLSGNHLKALPQALSGLTQLSVLQLTGNSLQEFPECVTRLSHLVTLHLGGNRLRTLPGRPLGLTRLQELDLSHNFLASLPAAISSLAALTRLDVGHNRLASLPDALSGLTALQHLVVASNELNMLPGVLGALTGLTHLDVNRTYCWGIATELSQLGRLQVLQFQSNQLSELPEEVLGGWTALHTLDLAYGTLSVLPASLGAQQHLTRLDATNSCLLHLPMDLMCLPRLEVLVLRNTRLWEWPASLFLAGCPALRHLEIDCCRGASLPGALGCLTGLTALRLVDTTTSTVMSLPKGMSALGQLQVLDISFLSLVPAAGWEVLEALAPTLRSLTARHMGWERLPAPLYTLTRLTYLDLSGTPLVEVGEELRGLTALQHLNLGTCQLGEMPACLAALPVLRVLHMRGNPLVAPSAHAVPPTQLQELTLPFCYTTNLAGLVQSTGLTRLVLRGNNLVSLQGAARLPSLPLLRHLDLSHNRLRNLKGLGPTPQLATLCLDFNRRLTCLTGLQLLGPLLGLRKLRLRGAAIRGGRGLGRHPGKLAALTALGPCPQLAYLDLRNNHLTGLTAEVWAWLAQQPRLAVLCLAGNCWAPDLGLWAPPVLPALQLLDLSACNLRTLPAWLPTLPACDTIQIRGNGGLDDVQAAEVLAAMPGLRQVACQFDLPPQLSHVEAMQPEHYDDEEEEAQEPAQLIV